jgi:tetratricopeptide (TPR) repeat protein
VALSQTDPQLPETAAAALLDRGVPVEVDGLLDEDTFSRLIETRQGYPAAELLVSWLLDLGGQELVGDVYSEMPLTAAGLAERLELTPEEVEAAFVAWMTARAASGESRYRFEQARANAAGLGRGGELAAARAELLRALTLRPGDAETLYHLAVIEIRADQIAEAEGHLGMILAQSDELPSSSRRYVVFAHYLLGKLYSASGRIEAARAEFETMLAIPDTHTSHQMARDELEQLEGAKEGEAVSED